MIEIGQWLPGLRVTEGMIANGRKRTFRGNGIILHHDRLCGYMTAYFC